MKKECSIIRDMLPLYFENMVSEDTAEFVKKHIENCPDCAAELKAMKSGKEISETEPSKRESDAKVITAVKKKIAKKIVKTVAVVCLAHRVWSAIHHPFPADSSAAVSSALRFLPPPVMGPFPLRGRPGGIPQSGSFGC